MEMEVYLDDVSKMVYYGNDTYYTYDENGEDIKQFHVNNMPKENEGSKVCFIECRDNSIIFYLYD